MNRTVDGDGAVSRIKDHLTAAGGLFKSSVTLSGVAFGALLILLGATVIDNGVLAGMFGIWGLTAIAASVGAYLLLWLNRIREERAAYRLDE